MSAGGEFDIDLDRDSIVTIHDQLVAHLSEKISNGALKPGSLLPSENHFSKDLKVSRMTVRRVFDSLAYAGLVARRHGKGTYVAPPTSRQQEKGLIGYIGQSLTRGASSELFSHLSAALEEKMSLRWHMLMCSAENDMDRQLRYVETLKDHDVQGILLTPAVVEDHLSNQTTIMALEQSGVPFVLMEGDVEGIVADRVLADHFRAGYIGTEHLISLGHARIAFIGNPHSPSIVDVGRGYRAALDSAEFTHVPELTFRRSELAARMRSVLEHGATALLAHSDFAAMEALSWCSQHDVHVPEQMAIVGIGNLRHAEGPEPVLTTLRKDFEAMASLALNVLVERIEKKGPPEPRREVIGVDLLVRSTCGAKGREALSPSSTPAADH
jgi:DNA-binding LacI/PurR family transcriptional regulator